MALSSTVELTWGLDDPFFSGGTTTSAEVWARWDVAFNGIGFMIDWNDGDQLQGPNTIPLYRYGGQIDAGVRPGEQSLSREDLWRRTIASMHRGAGQRWSDRKDSDEFRFRSSKGIDPWTRDRVTLLHDVTQVVASTTIWEAVAVPLVGSNVYLHYNDNGVWKVVNWTSGEAVGGFGGNVTGTGGLNYGLDGPQLASDGFNVFGISAASNFVYRNTGGGATSAVLWSTCPAGGNASAIGWCHGHLVVGCGSGGRTLADATAGPGGTATTVATLSQLGEQWTCFAEGASVIYGAANSAGVFPSKVYRIGFDPTTSTLSAPVVAGIIPVGETIKAIFGYLDFLFIGTSKGFRMARQATDGGLSIGPLIPTPGAVYGFSAVGPYVYFSWSNYDSVSTGTGRIDITQFTDADLVPAYASDLMATAQGTVRSVLSVDNSNATVNGNRTYFVVNGTGGGIFVQHPTDFVASGTYDTGLVGFDLSEQKDLVAIDIRTEPLAGTVTIAVAADEAPTFSSIDVESTAGAAGMYMPTRHIGGSRHELRVTLTRGSATTAPVLSSITMLAFPAVQRGELWMFSLIIQDDTIDASGYPQRVSFTDKVQAIRALAIPGTAPVTVQFGAITFQAHISDYQTSPFKLGDDGQPRATMRVQLKNLDRQVAA